MTDEEFVETANALAKEYNGDIDRESVTEIVKRSGRDYTMFVNNVRKLFTYTNQIRIMDVQQLVNNPLSDDVFSLFESLIIMIDLLKQLELLEIYLRWVMTHINYFQY